MRSAMALWVGPVDGAGPPFPHAPPFIHSPGWSCLVRPPTRVVHPLTGLVWSGNTYLLIQPAAVFKGNSFIRLFGLYSCFPSFCGFFCVCLGFFCVFVWFFLGGRGVCVIFVGFASKMPPLPIYCLAQLNSCFPEGLEAMSCLRWLIPSVPLCLCCRHGKPLTHPPTPFCPLGQSHSPSLPPPLH